MRVVMVVMMVMVVMSRRSCRGRSAHGAWGRQGGRSDWAASCARGGRGHVGIWQGRTRRRLMGVVVGRGVGVVGRSVVVVMVMVVRGGKGRRPELGRLLLGGAKAEGGVPVRIRSRRSRSRCRRDRACCSRIRSRIRGRGRRRYRTTCFSTRRVCASHHVASVTMMVMVVVVASSLSIIIAGTVVSMRSLQHRRVVAVLIHADSLARKALRSTRVEEELCWRSSG